jgi:transmembrane sensor
LNKQPNLPWEKLAQYFAGELTGEESRKMETWENADPERKKQIEKLYKIWTESESFPYHLNTDEAWQRLSASIDNSERYKAKVAAGSEHSLELYPMASSAKFRKAGVFARRVVLVAAAVLIAVTTILLTLHHQSVQEAGLSDEVMNRVIMTRDGERASFLLSDGSRVVLHAGSRIEIPEDYNTDLREMHLEGEAYFETAHNPDKPFIVHSRNAYTRVVGTRFLVQAWPESGQNVEVIVTEGKVLFGGQLTAGINREPTEVLVSQNQRAILTGDAEFVVEKMDDLDWYLGWTEGRLVFNNRELQEVLPRLERWYNITIEVADESIKSQKITAQIDYSLPMSDVLHGMALTLGLEIEKGENRKYLFR